MGLQTSRYKRVYALTNLLQTKYSETVQVKDYPRILSIINGTEFCSFSGNAMTPTLEDSDTLVEVRKRASLKGLYVGDVVALTNPSNLKDVLIRRLTAAENDELVSSAGLEPRTVPKGHVWVNSDNSSVMIDSREFGFVSHDLLLGRVTTTLNASYQPTGVVVNSPQAMAEDAQAELVTADLLQAYIKQIRQLSPWLKWLQSMESKNEKNEKDD